MAQRCSGEEETTFRVALNGGAFRSILELSGYDVGIEEAAVLATVDWRRGDRWTFQLGLGAIAGGALRIADRSWAISPGGVISAGGSYLLYAGDGWKPFVLLGGEVSVSLASGGGAALTSGDVRASVTAGHTFAKAVTPYLAARVFGGPVLWQVDGQSVSGGDRYHYQLAAGLVATLPAGFDVSAEVAPVGEQRVSLGVGRSF